MKAKLWSRSVQHMSFDKQRCNIFNFSQQWARTNQAPSNTKQTLTYFLLFCVLATTTNAWAGVQTIVGPEFYLRESGKPVVVQKSFTNALVVESCIMTVFNGGLEDDTYENVSSSMIDLNDSRIFTPKDFNQKVNFIQKAVTLESTNALDVELRGKPGGALTIVIDCDVVDATPPEIIAAAQPEPNTNGWNNTDVTVTFDCSDADSGIAGCTDPIVLNTEGTEQIVTGEATDVAGNTASTSLLLSIDRTQPTITASLNSEAGANGWHATDVTVSFSCTDGGSQIESCTTPVAVANEGLNQAIEGSAVDLAGNTASVVMPISIDRTAPTITAELSSPANAQGWHDDGVTITFVCADMLSGVDDCPDSITVTSEGGDQVFSGTATDLAGNSASISVTLHIDQAGPTINGTANPTANANGWNNSDVTVSFSCSDAGAGITQCTDDALVSAEGANQAIEGIATDGAGHTAGITHTVNIDKAAPSITLALSAEADSNGWHSDDVTITSICSDALSGVAGCPAPILVTTEGENQLFSGTATDVAGNTASASVTLNINKTNLPDNSAPVAHDAELTEAYNTVIRLYGSGSDPDGDALSFTWTIESGPEGNYSAITEGAPGEMYFSANMEGDYVLSLVAFDGELYSEPVTVLIHYIVLNLPPITDVDADQEAALGTVVTIESHAYDPEDRKLFYTWSVVSSPIGSSWSIDPEGSAVHFTADLVGDYQLSLQAFDGEVYSQPDYVVISFIVSSNQIPVANAGTNIVMELGDGYYFEGQGFDPEGESLSFEWSLIYSPDGSDPYVDPYRNEIEVEPDLPGDYVLSLRVFDGILFSEPDEVILRALPENVIDIAGITLALTVNQGETIQLNGPELHEDIPQNNTTSFEWYVLDGYDVGRPYQLPTTSPNGADTEFTATAAGLYALVVFALEDESQVAFALISITSIPGNQAPIANAGVDQTVSISQVISLNGSAQDDNLPVGSPLTYVWSILSSPSLSSAELTQQPDSAAAQLAVDTTGDYVVSLTVSDGEFSSAPDTVLIRVLPDNTAPVADAGEDQTLTEGDSLLLVGTASDDGLPLSQTLSFQWQIISSPQNSSPDLNQATNGEAELITSTPGVYVLSLVAFDGELSSEADTVIVELLPANAPPSVSAGADQQLFLDQEAQLRGSVSDDGLPTDSTLSTLWTQVSGPAIAEIVDPSAPLTAINFSVTGNYLFVFRGEDGEFDVEDQLIFRVFSRDIPPDPATVAPPLTDRVFTRLSTATAFLYGGDQPIQQGVFPDTIDEQRAAVIRGRVLSRDGSPLAGVGITIEDHPEFGLTLSRDDGMFDLAVNGGGQLIVHYAKAGFIAVERYLQIPWQQYVTFEDVVMIEFDSFVNAIDLTSSTPIQVARGTMQVDDAGERQATLLFPTGTSAEMVFGDGSTQALNSLSVRLTEATVGASGRQAMPYPLPAQSAYTYAVELSVDEAREAGAEEVRFSEPVIFYVDNFLEFPVGLAVPVGSLGRNARTNSCGVEETQEGWVAEKNGVVISIVSETGGLADVDSDGDGSADDAVALAGIGMTEQERASLAELYDPGQSLWRAQVDHFSWIDLNYPLSGGGGGGGGGGRSPGPPKPQSDSDGDEYDCESDGSVIGCLSQSLGEIIPIKGTPYGLHYKSNRALSQLGYALNIPLSSALIRDDLQAIKLEIQIAGQTFIEEYPAAPNQSKDFIWDGKDAYGRTVAGAQTVSVDITYMYPFYYAVPPNGAKSFGLTCDGSAEFPPSSLACIIPDSLNPRARQSIEEVYSWQGSLGSPNATSKGIGGWELGIHHSYDLSKGILHYGNGKSSSSSSLTPVIETIAGTNMVPPGYTIEEGLPAIETIMAAREISVGADGSLFFIDYGSWQIFRIDPEGIVRRVTANNAVENSSTCPSPIELQHTSMTSLELGPDGSIFWKDSTAGNLSVIRRLSPDGRVTRIAGRSICSLPCILQYIGDGLPATDNQFNGIKDIAISDDGTLYILSFRQVYRVASDGLIYVVAGTGASGPGSGYSDSAEGGLATLANLSGDLKSIEIGADGSLYIVDRGSYRVFRVTPDGTINTVAGTGNKPNDNEARPNFVPATEFDIDPSRAIKVLDDGSFYIVDSASLSLYHVGVDGLISLVAGSSDANTSEDGTAATEAKLSIRDLEVANDGSILIVDGVVIRRIASKQAALNNNEISVASKGGNFVYVFDRSGRHLRTVHSLKNQQIYGFSYDTDGLLIGVTDSYGNVTTIERAANGDPMAIVAAIGPRTELAVDANGFLSRITYLSHQIEAEYLPNGLLTSVRDTNGGLYEFTYDALGRLLNDKNPGGGEKSLARTETEGGFEVELSTLAGKSTTMATKEFPNGDRLSTATAYNGTQSSKLVSGNRTVRTIAAGTVMATIEKPDPRFGMQSAYIAELSVTTPSGLQNLISIDKGVTLDNEFDPLSVNLFTKTVTANGKQMISTYNANDRTERIVSPEGRQAVLQYDAGGHISQWNLAGLFPTELQRDDFGRIIDLQRGDRIFSRSFDAGGLLATTTNPLGLVTQYNREASSGRVGSLVPPDGNAIEYQYDSAGNIVSITPPGGPAHLFSYSNTNKRLTYTSPDIGSGIALWTDSYDIDGKLTSMAGPDGRVVEFVRDAAGRIADVVIPRVTVSSTFDSVTGLLSAMSVSDGSWMNFSYDGHLMTRSGWGGTGIQAEVTREYNNDFKVSKLTVNSTEVASFSYDDDNYMVAAGPLDIIRSADNSLVTGTQLSAVSTTNSYDGHGELNSLIVESGQQTLFSQSISERDLNGDITELEESVAGISRKINYSYDTMGRLTQVSVNDVPLSNYTYDLNSNRLSAGTVLATYDERDQLRTRGAVVYSQTLAGHRLSKTDSSSSQTTTYSYDTLGNLISIVLPGGTTVEYEIDARFRRVAQRVDENRQRGFVYVNGLKPVAELAPDNSIRSLFIYATDRMVADVMIRDGIQYRIISDHGGSVRLVVNADTGTIAQRLDYDAFGVVLFDSNPGFQPFGFAGGLYDYLTGLVRFGARDYDAEAGRWTAMDPILFQGGSTNLYTYAGNNPINRRDSNGLEDNLTSFEDEQPWLQEQADGVSDWQNDILDEALQQDAPDVWDAALKLFLENQMDRQTLGDDSIRWDTEDKLKALLAKKAQESKEGWKEAKDFADGLDSGNDNIWPPDEDPWGLKEKEKEDEEDIVDQLDQLLDQEGCSAACGCP